MSHDNVKNTRTSENRYELIVVAAREARRLNDYYRQRNVQPKSRVTTEAMGRAIVDGITYAFRVSDALPSERTLEGTEFGESSLADTSDD